jgi:hypothetical protein
MTCFRSKISGSRRGEAQLIQIVSLSTLMSLNNDDEEIGCMNHARRDLCAGCSAMSMADFQQNVVRTFTRLVDEDLRHPYRDSCDVQPSVPDVALFCAAFSATS